MFPGSEYPVSEHFGLFVHYGTDAQDWLWSGAGIFAMVSLSTYLLNILFSNEHSISNLQGSSETNEPRKTQQKGTENASQAANAKLAITH
jgi:hypothetical protein